MIHNTTSSTPSPITNIINWCTTRESWFLLPSRPTRTDTSETHSSQRNTHISKKKKTSPYRTGLHVSVTKCPMDPYPHAVACNTHFGINYFLFSNMVSFFQSMALPRCLNWTLDSEPVLPAPAILFYDWSAVSHSKSRDFRFWSHDFRSLPVEPASPLTRGFRC